MKVVILAGGLGTRISEETSFKPKPMIEIGGKPILWHIMKTYSHHGINDFVICCGYKGYVIKEYFANYFLHMSDVTFDMSTNRMEVHRRNAEPWKVTLVNTGEDTMTGGRLKRVADCVKDEEAFCLTYGDGVSDVNVTTDKCYENKEWNWGYRENEPMGGHDPYSNSKGCSELVTSAYRRSFFQEKEIALASARAGNVIGGGDWAADRLIPDILRAFEKNQPVIIRNPHATRPWQHVLEPLSGYLTLVERLCTDGQACAEGWNFGPHDDDARPVQWIVEHMVNSWGNGASWQQDGGTHPHEANYLKLDIAKAKARLGWQPRWPLAIALKKITAWHHAYLNSANMHEFTLEQIQNYVQPQKDQLSC